MEDRRPLIALVAHDSMKTLMANFAQNYREELSNFRLTGTGTTCRILRGIGLTPEDQFVPSGPLGGDQVLGAMITEQKVHALFFFRDPLTSHIHIADCEALARVADVYQIYYCTNYRTAAGVLQTMTEKILAARAFADSSNFGAFTGTVGVSDYVNQLGTSLRERNQDFASYQLGESMQEKHKNLLSPRNSAGSVRELQELPEPQSVTQASEHCCRQIFEIFPWQA